MGLAVFFADAAMETSVTTGTGSFSLAGPVAGWPTSCMAVNGDGRTSAICSRAMAGDSGAGASFS